LVPGSAPESASGELAVDGRMKIRARFHFPHPLALLFGITVFAALLSYVLPAGEYERRVDTATGRTVVVAGTYHEVASTPVGAFQTAVAFPRGLIAAADILVLILLAGGAFTVLDESGTLRRAVASLVKNSGSGFFVIPVVSAIFAIGGIVENMQEEIIALIPVLLVLTRRVGYPPVVAVAMSAGAAIVGSAFSPINPFQVQLAQKLAELPLGSGGLFRSVFLVLALTWWIAMTMRVAARTRLPVELTEREDEDYLTRRDGLTLGVVLVTFIVLVWGMSNGWGFNDLGALFLIMGIVVGIISGMGVSGTAEAYVKGFRSMAAAAVMVGFARAIFVVLEDGHIIDTIVNGLFAPLEGLPLLVSGVGLVAAQTVIHVFVPSATGHAVLTMPVLVPLSDLLEMSRQVTVLTYQYGGGLCDLITPTNGTLLAILSVAGLTFADWMRFAFRLYLGLIALSLGAIAMAIAIGV
jgi:uncharacterized ion transporter superfamily protein YfcC